MTKNIKTGYYHVWMAIVAIFYIVAFMLLRPNPWSDQQIMILLCGLLIIGVNWLYFYFQIRQGSFDEKIPILGFSWLGQLLYTIFTISSLVLLAFFGFRLRFQVLVQVGLLLIVALQFIVMHHSSSQVHLVSRSQMHVEHENVELLFRKAIFLLESRNIDQSLFDIFKNHAENYKFIAPSNKDDAYKQELSIKKELEAIIYEDSGTLEDHVKQIGLILKIRKDIYAD